MIWAGRLDHGFRNRTRGRLFLCLAFDVRTMPNARFASDEPLTVRVSLTLLMGDVGSFRACQNFIIHPTL
jgi:hypothetical protein